MAKKISSNWFNFEQKVVLMKSKICTKKFK